MFYYNINKNKTYEQNKNVNNPVGNNAGPMPAQKNNVTPSYNPTNTKSTNDTSYVPGSGTAELKKNFVNAQNQNKVNGFAKYIEENYGPKKETVQTVASVQTTPEPKTWTDPDYASEIIKLSQLPTTPENVQAMEQALNTRRAKIGYLPENYGQFADDAIDKLAVAYLSQTRTPEVSPEQYLKSLYGAANERLEIENNLIDSNYNSDADNLKAKYEQLRKNSLIDAARKALGAEEVMAAQGLGRGISNDASSGFGESSRMMANASLNNALAETYLSESQALEQLQRQRDLKQLQARLQYYDDVSNIDKYGLDQINADREAARLEKGDFVGQAQTGTDNKYRDKVYDRNVIESDRDYDRSVYTDDRNYRRSVFENDRDYETALDQFEKTYALDKYKAETDRISTNNKGSSGGTTYVFGDGKAPTVESNTYTDAEAMDIVRNAYYASGGSNSDALDTILYLRNNNQISPIAEQMLVEELGLYSNNQLFK